MKTDFLHRGLATGACLLSLTGSFSPSSPAHAQTPAANSSPAGATAARQNEFPLIDAPVFAPVLRPDGNLTVSLPANYPLNTSRLRIGIFEAGRPTRVADIEKDFVVANGGLQASVNIQAAPGAYEIRLLSGNKERTPISRPATLIVPGIDREPGWWLLNGSPFSDASAGFFPFVADGTGLNPAAPKSAASNAATPFFIPGLRRDLGRKPKAPRGDIPVASNTPLSWKTFPLFLSEMATPGYDFAAFQVILQKQISEAEARGERGFLGFQLGYQPSHSAVPTITTKIQTLTKLRTVLSVVAPEAALVLQVSAADVKGAPFAQEWSALAPLCDAVLIDTSSTDDQTLILWAVKAMRRIAEEQPSYDLPIFVGISPVLVRIRPDSFYTTWVYDPTQPSKGHDQREAKWWSNAEQLDLWQAGATGFVRHVPPNPKISGGPSGSAREIQNIIQRNLPLFVNSVTLEDIGILPPPDGESTTEYQVTDTTDLYDIFRGTGRIPLLARLGDDKNTTESFAISFGDRVSEMTIKRIRDVAERGARVYVEGAPFQDETGKYVGWRLSNLVGGEAKKLEGDATKNTEMTLEDGWTFGTGRGTRVNVRQAVSVTLGKGTMAAQAKTEKGKYTLTAPRAAAVLADGTPALVIAPVGKGEVIWMPHRPNIATKPVAHAIAPIAETTPAAFPEARPLPEAGRNIDRSTTAQRYYAAIAAYMQPGLSQLRGVDAKFAGPEKVRVALRRSPRGAFLLALFNDADTPAAIGASIDGAAGVALDLETERELPLAVRGFQSEASVMIPAHGWKLVAFAESRKSLDEERNAPRGKIRLR
ncbi:MAG TPA: hypothetical protein VF719_05740 [Abditibacteriaceae bacterium]